MRYGLGVVMILSSTMLLSPNFPPHRIPLAGPNVSFVWVSFKWLASLLMRCFLFSISEKSMIKSENNIEIYNMGLIFRVSTIDALLVHVFSAWEDNIPRKGAWLWQGKTTLSNRFKFAFAPASSLGQMRGKVRQIQVNYAGVGRGSTLCQLHPCRC